MQQPEYNTSIIYKSLNMGQGRPLRGKGTLHVGHMHRLNCNLPKITVNLIWSNDGVPIDQYIFKLSKLK